MPLATIMMVYPSGLALATCAAPILPPAPGLFSTTIGWPRSLASDSPSVRAITSIAPPGGKGTIQVMGRSGYAAAAAEAANRPAIAAAAQTVLMAGDRRVLCFNCISIRDEWPCYCCAGRFRAPGVACRYIVFFIIRIVFARV